MNKAPQDYFEWKTVKRRSSIPRLLELIPRPSITTSIREWRSHLKLKSPPTPTFGRKASFYSKKNSSLLLQQGTGNNKFSTLDLKDLCRISIEELRNVMPAELLSSSTSSAFASVSSSSSSTSNNAPQSITVQVPGESLLKIYNSLYHIQQALQVNAPLLVNQALPSPNTPPTIVAKASETEPKAQEVHGSALASTEAQMPSAQENQKLSARPMQTLASPNPDPVAVNPVDQQLQPDTGSQVSTPLLSGDGVVGRSSSQEKDQVFPLPLFKKKRHMKANRNKAVEANNSSDSTVSAKVSPPINVLIVEDNPINLRILSAFMKKRKINFSVATTGVEAIQRWKDGGFHLILMDIQLSVINADPSEPTLDGIDATKEIRKCEKEKRIGVFGDRKYSSKNGSSSNNTTQSIKAPVIIVALTASSNKSVRNAALAAGCNDFLTKPVDFEWLDRKIMQWGCMQALIDFDEWRNWRNTDSTQVINHPV